MASSVNYGTQQYFSFDPRTIPGCQLWLDAADSRTVQTSGSSLTTWVDKSINGYNATPQSTAPTYSNNGIVFAGTSILNTGLSMATLTTMTYFAVGTYTGSAAQKDIIGVFTSTAKGGWQVTFNNNVQRTTTYDGTIINTGSTVSLSSRFLYNGTLVTGGSSTTYLNGSLTNTATAPALSPNGTLTIGGYRDAGSPNGAELYDGTLNEIIVYNTTLTTAQRQQIEGYLAWKWNLTTSAGLVSPATISGLQLWLDAASITGVANGNTLSSWNDRSSNAYTGTAIASPVYNTNSLNGLPGVVFNGSSQYINFGNVLNMGTASAIYIFAVCRFNTTADGHVVGKTSARGFAGRWSLLRQAAGGGMLMLIDVAGSGVTAGYANTSTSAQLLGGFWDRTTITSSLNGGSTLATTALSSSVNMTNTDPLWVGAYPSSTGSTPPTTGLYFNGSIHEILVYLGTLSTLQRQQIEGYLAWKWGLATSLPSSNPYNQAFTLPTGHPYSRIPPTMRFFSPLDIDTCCLWLDALDGFTFTPANPSSGTTITAWRDKSSNAMSCTPSNGNSGRTITYRTTTGFPSVFINNVSNTGTALAAQGYINVPNQIQNGFSDFTCLAVVNLQPTTNANDFFLQSVYANQKGTSGESRLQIGLGSTFEFNTTAAAVFSGIGVQFDSNVRNTRLLMTTMSTSTGLRQFLDGYLWQGDTFTSGSRFTTDLGFTPRIGATAIDGRAATGDYYEMICYNRVLTDAERINVESYLMNKWNITRGYTYTPSNTQILLPNASSINGNLGLWNDATSYSTNQTLTTWVNRTGGTASTCTGSVVINQLNGNPVVRFAATNTFTSFNMNYSSYTMLFVTRYNGTGNTGRIFQGPSGTNTLYGYWNGNKATLWTEGNPGFLDGSGQAKVRNNLWDLVSHRRTANGPFNMRWNQIQIYNGSTSVNANLTTLNINTGGWPNETSACDVAELLVYNTYLTDTQVIQLENYLNAKWNVVPRNFYAGLTSPPTWSATPLFVPTQLSNLALWLDAADSSTITTSGSDITQWNDKSGNNRNATSPQARPTLVANVINGLPVVRFSNPTTSYSSGYQTQYFSVPVFNVDSVTERSVYIVARVSSTRSYDLQLNWEAPIGWQGFHSGLHINKTNVNQFYFQGTWWNSALNTNVDAATAIAQNTPVLMCDVWSISGTAIVAQFLNGNTGSVGTNTGMTNFYSGYTNLYLGCTLPYSLGNGFNYLYNGDIAELIVFSGPISASQRQQVEGYLTWKWGLKNSLPTTHPYYNNRP